MAVYAAPLKEAEKYLSMAMIHIEDESIDASIEELKKVKERAVSAFQILKGLGSKTENLENAIKATQLKVFSEVLVQSYDGAKLTPFFLLEKKKQKIIGRLIEDDVNDLQSFYNTHSFSLFTMKKSEKGRKKQDLLNVLLRASYPLISQGRGLTNALAPVGSPVACELTILSDLLPEGEEEGTLVTIGQRGDWPVVVKAWRKGDMVQAETLSGNEDQIIHCWRCILIVKKNALFLSRWG